MNLRRLFGASVVLACSLVVLAAPIANVNDNVDIEAREWDLELASRTIPGNYYPEAYGYYAYDRRAAPVTPPAPKPKVAAAPSKQPPSRQPPKQQPPKQQPPKQQPPKQQPPKQQPPKQQAPVKPVPNQQTPAKPDPKQQPPTKKPGSCPIGNGKAKREFSTDCDKATITLGGVTRSITKVSDQGNSAITYKVDAGWPDSHGTDVVAYVKTGKTANEKFEDEIKWLGDEGVQQLLAQGEYEGRNFIVFRGVSDKRNLDQTQYWFGVYMKYLTKGKDGKGKIDVDGCKAELKTKFPLIVTEAKYYVDKYQVLHMDLHNGNILWDDAAAEPTLIDWGKARKVAKWDASIEKSVNDQLVSSFLGAGGICVSYE